MEEGLNNLGAEKQNRMQSLRNELADAEKAGNEAEVLRIEGEIRKLEGNDTTVEQQEESSADNNEVMTPQESLPSKEVLEEEISANVEELGELLNEKEPRFIKEKAQILLGRLGQVALGGIGVISVASIGLHSYDAIQAFIDMDGPTSVLTGKPFIGAVELTAKGRVVSTYQAIAVWSLVVGTLALGGGLIAQEKIDKIKNRIASIKKNFQVA